MGGTDLPTSLLLKTKMLKRKKKNKKQSRSD